MRIPSIPPPLDFAAFESPEVLMRVLQESDSEATRPDRYLHWDEIRHRKPPKGLSREQWWTGLKIKRSSQQQEIPLVDEKGRPFVFSLTPRMFELLHEVDLKCGGVVEGPGAVTNRDTRDRYYISSLVEEAITSSQLEGAAVTRAVAKEMIRSRRKPADDDERMILNNFLTMREISEWKDRDLTPELLLRIHSMISRGTLEDPEQEGRLRLPEEPVRAEDEETGEVIHTPPPAGELVARIDRLCAFANESRMTGYLHPVIRSIILHFWVAYEHPFVDGNGRTARALFYWSMLRNDFWLFEFISISRQILGAPRKYDRAFLHTETDSNDLNYFLFHQLSVIIEAIDDLHGYVRRKSEELSETESLLGLNSGLNNRQIALLRHAIKHPGFRYTVASHQVSHGISINTSRSDLEELAKRGLLTKSRKGKSHVYEAVEDMPARLRIGSENDPSDRAGA